MDIKVDYVHRKHEHIAGFPHSEPADPLTHNARLELQEHVNYLRADPDLVKTWHTMIDPLDSQPAPCQYDIYTRRSNLTNAAMIMIAYAQGYDGKSDVRHFYKERGIYSVKGSVSEDIPGIGRFDKPHLPNALIQEFTEIRNTGTERHTLPHVYYAAELCLDNSHMPINEFTTHDYHRWLWEYFGAEPTTGNAYFRRAAYAGFEAVIENVARLTDPTTEELLLQLSASQHLLSMQQMDWRISKYLHRLSYPDLFQDGEYRTLDRTDLVSILKEDPRGLVNTGNPTIDSLAYTPWLISDRMTEDIRSSIIRIFNILSDETGLMSKLSRAQFRGQVHEAMWLIDAVMISTVFGSEDLLFSKAISREDRNFMLNKPAVKRTFDIQVFELGRVFRKTLQLKSSELSASRGQYDESISVLVEKNFNDTHPRRLIKKRNAYKSILSMEQSNEQARKTLSSLALPSVAQTIIGVLTEN